MANLKINVFSHSSKYVNKTLIFFRLFVGYTKQQINVPRRSIASEEAPKAENLCDVSGESLLNNRRCEVFEAAKQNLLSIAQQNGIGHDGRS